MKRECSSGFTLVELLLALTIGLVVGGAVIQALLATTALTSKMARQLRQQEFAQRARRLVESDLQRARAVSQAPGQEQAACNLGGRTAVLHLVMGPGVAPITYLQGSAPSAIWQGPVLMRCGPAFDLDGRQNLTGAWQNRVVLDAMGDQQGLLGWMRGVAQRLN
jgi:prepilin-type N-terminal cleavage/methylation domain-containing protein